MKTASKILLLILFAIIGVFAGYNLKNKPDYIYKYDTITSIEVIEFPVPDTTIFDTLYKPYYKDTGSTRIIVRNDTILREVDTGKILRKYFAIHYYNDTFDIDTHGHAIINDVVAMNRIRARSFKYDISIPERQERSHIRYGIGAFAGYKSAGIELSYLKNDNQYTAGYDLYNGGFNVGFTKHFKNIKIWE